MAANILQAFAAQQLTTVALKHAISEVVRLAERQMPGANEADKKAWATRELTAALEQFDNRIPVIGELLDMPVTDRLEQQAVAHAVDGAFLRLKSLNT